MEASETTVTPEAETEVEASRAETSPAEARHPQELFRYSQWCHVGPGAETCEGGEDGSCADGMHFHAWCRLPNQFQHQSIVNKALAAKARRIRAYRDPETDESAVLDGQLDEIEHATNEEAARETYIEEIVFKDYMKDYFDAIQEMTTEEPEDGEEGDPPKWNTIAEDQERLRALEDMDEESRPESEYEQLKSHVAEYTEAVEALVKEKHEPVRASLRERPTAELRQMVRENRIQKEANGVYMQTYTLWEQYIGTMKPQAQGMPGSKPGVVGERVYKDIEHLKSAAPEVVSALDQVFTDMDGEFGKTLAPGLSGKGF